MITTFYDCYQVLTKVYSQGAFITNALNSTQVEPLKRREITKICYGVVDKDIELSYYITKLTSKAPKQATAGVYILHTASLFQRCPHPANSR